MRYNHNQTSVVWGSYSQKVYLIPSQTAVQGKFRKRSNLSHPTLIDYSKFMLVGVTLRNRFKIIKKLGSGGFGDTYLAEDIDCKNHPCVVKHLQLKPPNTADALPIAQRLFATEAEVLYKLGVHDQYLRCMLTLKLMDNFI